MGKSTGFLEYERRNNPEVECEKRVKNFNEFHPMMNKAQRQEQGARCMNCGVPFCQSGMKLNGMVSGCPLHNLVPEWNDEIYNGNWEHALSRLRKTNNFPEFTGRVCPALCEAACTCAMYGDAVTVKENELAIITNGYEMGLIKPEPPEVRTDKKVAVIGSGPSGLACADQLNKRGHNVTVFERFDRPGGLLMYGIPNMKLDKSVVERRIKLMEDEGVKFILNADVTQDKKLLKKVKEEFDAVVICTGAGNPRDIKAEGRDAEGIYFAVDFLRSTTKALLDNGLKEGGFISAKGKRVVIIGGGDTGNDCVGTSIRHGCKSVTQIEMMPKPPEKRTEDNPWPQWPKVLKTDYGQSEAIALFGSDPRIYKTTVKRFLKDEKGKLTGVELVKLESEKDEGTGRMMMKPVEGSEYTLECDMVLIAAGFLGPDPKVCAAFDVKTNARSNVETALDGYASSKEKVFCAGDARRGQSLVVWAISEGRAAAKEVDNFLMEYTNMI